MRVALLGATGFLGARLVPVLRRAGHELVVYSRDAATVRQRLGEGVGSRSLGALDTEPLEVDAVINLAGEPVASKRWNADHKARIRSSRVDTTRRVVEAIGRASQRPHTLVNASAVGFYGACGDETVDETHAHGHDFLSEVCTAWEAEALRAEALGVRVVRARIGVVLGPSEGALAQMVMPFKWFAGGAIGDGRQYLPWVHVDDAVGMLALALDNATVRGAMNVTAPEPARSEAFAKALGRVMERPSWLTVPAFALRVAVGEMAEVILTGQRAVPSVAQRAGYRFTHEDLEAALRDALRPA